MEDKYFNRRSDIISLIIVATHLIIVIGPVYISACMGPGYHLILAWLIFGLGLNGIINLMHECAHYLVFKDKSGSKFLGKYIIAPLIFTNFDIYRKRHWAHHKHLGVKGETKDTYLIDIKGMHILFLFLRCILCIEAFNKFFKQIDSIVSDELYEHDSMWAFRTVFVQIVFFLSIIFVSNLLVPGDWMITLKNASVAYLLVYVYGVMSLTVFVADLRAIAEHQLYLPEETHEGRAALRNFKCNLISRFILGAYGFGEHYTHHKVPGIPYYELKKATKELAQADSSLAPQKGYFQTISAIISSNKKT